MANTDRNRRSSPLQRARADVTALTHSTSRTSSGKRENCPSAQRYSMRKSEPSVRPAPFKLANLRHARIRPRRARVQKTYHGNAFCWRPRAADPKDRHRAPTPRREFATLNPSPATNVVSRQGGFNAARGLSLSFDHFVRGEQEL